MLHMHNAVFDCNKCLVCRKKQGHSLALRCVLHASLYQQNAFLTLTYDESRDGYHNNLDYSEIQKFKKRLRKHVKSKIEIFNVHEYGKNGKKHWHLIVFGWSPDDKRVHTYKSGLALYTSPRLEKLWPFGFSTCGDVSEASAMYQSLYTQKDIKNGNRGTSKQAKSNHRGIGLPFFEKHYRQLMQLGYIPHAGKKHMFPRSFERRARRHWSYYYQQSDFWDLPDRKKLYNPPKNPNREIADLYPFYIGRKKQFIQEVEQQWRETISNYITTKQKPQFVKSGEVLQYDLNKKITKERF